MHQSHILLTERLGLGSTSHSHDAEMHALILAIDLLNKTPVLEHIAAVILVSDAALVLQQLLHPAPQSGNALATQWWDKTLHFIETNPHITLRVMWGPSKSTFPLIEVDLLAKRSRTTGASLPPTIRYWRMALRNKSLQKWRKEVQASNTPRDGCIVEVQSCSLLFPSIIIVSH